MRRGVIVPQPGCQTSPETESRHDRRLLLNQAKSSGLDWGSLLATLGRKLYYNKEKAARGAMKSAVQRRNRARVARAACNSEAVMRNLREALLRRRYFGTKRTGEVEQNLWAGRQTV